MKPPEDREGSIVRKSGEVTRWRFTFQPGAVHSLFEELIHRRWGQARWRPDTDVFKTPVGYVILVDLPGVEEDSVKVSLRGRHLLIEGRRVTRRSVSIGTVMVSERREGRFWRDIQFSEVVENFSVSESMGSGVLRIVLTRT
jgi:HSP20 family molecular chaperone IbpA